METISKTFSSVRKAEAFRDRYLKPNGLAKPGLVVSTVYNNDGGATVTVSPKKNRS